MRQSLIDLKCGIENMLFLLPVCAMFPGGFP